MDPMVECGAWSEGGYDDEFSGSTEDDSPEDVTWSDHYEPSEFSGPIVPEEGLQKRADAQSAASRATPGAQPQPSSNGTLACPATSSAPYDWDDDPENMEENDDQSQANLVRRSSNRRKFVASHSYFFCH